MHLHIESHEGDIYLAYTEDKDGKQLLSDKNDAPLKFKGLAHAKEHFAGKNFEQVWLSHYHVCDEVIGADTGFEQPKIALHWQ